MRDHVFCTLRRFHKGEAVQEDRDVRRLPKRPVKAQLTMKCSKTFPVYYLPKTNPSIPPLCVLPPASRHLENPPLFLSGADRMESFSLVPSFRSKGTVLAHEKLSATQRHALEKFKSSVYVCTFPLA